jgi:hypothetical protein
MVHGVDHLFTYLEALDEATFQNVRGITDLAKTLRD